MPTCGKRFETLAPICPESGPRLSEYRDLYIASHQRHLAQIPADSESLVVATEWATLQAARERGLDAVHTDWPRSLHKTTVFPATDVLLRSYEWIKENGADSTLYKGVSLVSMYAGFLSCTLLDITRIDMALRHLCTAFSIRRIVVFDISTAFHFMGPTAKRTLIRQIGDDLNIPVEEMWDFPEANDEGFYYRSIAPNAPRRTIRDLLRAVTGQIVECVFRIKLANCRSPRVFLFISTLSLKKMVERKPEGITPVIPFGSSPKTREFLGACWRNGILLAAQGASVSARKRDEICAAMMVTVESDWRNRPATGVEAVYREVVRESVLKPDILAGLAESVDSLDRLIDRLNIRRVVSGDATAPIGRALCELARAKGIGADESLNGVFASPLRDPIRMEIGGARSPVSRELAMGPVVKKWLSISDSHIPSVVTGYPGLGRLEAGPLAKPKLSKALVLPIYAWLNDADAWSSKLSPTLVEMIRGLSSIGFDSIRLKIHPGIDNLAYYQWLLDHFKLPCILDQTGAFSKHLDWADIVVGPPGSGTFLETLAAGKPYYVLRPEPTAIPDELLAGAVVRASADKICSAISEGKVPDRDLVLAQWCALGAVKDPPSAIWTMIAKGIEEDNP